MSLWPVCANIFLWHWKILLISCFGEMKSRAPFWTCNSNPVYVAANTKQSQNIIKTRQLWCLGQDFKDGGMWKCLLVPGVHRRVIRPDSTYNAAYKIWCCLLTALSKSDGLRIRIPVLLSREPKRVWIKSFFSSHIYKNSFIHPSVHP